MKKIRWLYIFTWLIFAGPVHMYTEIPCFVYTGFMLSHILWPRTLLQLCYSQLKGAVMSKLRTYIT